MVAIQSKRVQQKCMDAIEVGSRNLVELFGLLDMLEVENCKLRETIADLIEAAELVVEENDDAVIEK